MRHFTLKGPPKCSGEASGGTLSAPGRPFEASKGGQKKNEIGLRGFQDAPRAENPGFERGPMMLIMVMMPIHQIFVHIDSEKILESIFGPFLTPKSGPFLDHFYIFLM